MKALRVESVNPTGQAFKIGIERGDLLFSYGGSRLEEPEMLIKLSAETTEESNHIELLRNGEYLQITASKGSLGIQMVSLEVGTSVEDAIDRRNKAISEKENAISFKKKMIAESIYAMEYEYKVIDVADGEISSVLLGEGRIETSVLQAYINAMASEGWRMVFMTKVMQRHVVVADRETLMVTFERRVPEGERAARAARCIDDVIRAEEVAKAQGYKAAAGAAGLIAGGIALNALFNDEE